MIRRKPMSLPDETNRAIFLCRKERFSIQEFWQRDKKFI